MAVPGRNDGPIWLVGPPGAGKSTVGRMLAESLGCPFRDLDEEIAAAAGRSIADIFAREGEALFRIRERRALTAAATGRAVVACGAGVVEGAANRRLLARTGRVLWLDLPVAEALERCRRQPGLRPLLADEAAFRERLEGRLPRYREVGLQIDARGEPREVAARARAALAGAAG